VSRVQLALNVSDLDQAVEFYSKLFATPPAKLRPGYANFAVTEPALKLVLIQNEGQPNGSINHLGVEVESTQLVEAAKARLAAAGLTTVVEDEVTCCYALQDKVWAHGPGGEEWEFYTVLSDTEMSEGQLRAGGPNGAACCADRRDLAGAAAETSCC